ncbi:hypothetical protein LOK49_LG04G02990 [Camellia lanceoleosa]|uniref:Uncharacterized protein n=1 Tax=Camellia lanceoleosa TaxID=1840588 RepID=A0ACC0I1W9_9ERIC|nr:hypothetical protein LOK49_LG04G02990 [Camellia lanceoleosa]
MKTAQAWRLRMKDMQILPAPRHRAHLKKPIWIIVLVSLVCVFLICSYIYPPHNSAACYVFPSNGCNGFSQWMPPPPSREFTDDEIASRVVIRDILNMPPIQSKNPKIAFVYLTPGKWHPKSYRAQDITYELMRNITLNEDSVHVTSDERKETQARPCLWNGTRWPCYLFGRKFMPETLDNLMELFSNYTSI